MQGHRSLFAMAGLLTCFGLFACSSKSGGVLGDAGHTTGGTGSATADTGATGGTGTSTGDAGQTTTRGTSGGDASADGGACPVCPPGGVCDPATRKCIPCSGASCGSTRTTCINSLDCADAGKTGVCDTISGTCVDCLTIADCPADNDCTNHTCVPYDPCTNSLDCQSGKVCDKTRGRCVECVTNADCPEEERCSNFTCRRACSSDKQCTAFGQLCDDVAGVCASCLVNGDCPEYQYCSQGTCLSDVCLGGTSSCLGNALLVCDPSGAQYTEQSCGTAQTCVSAAPGIASCQSQLCTPNVTSCDPTGKKVLVCAADGLSQTTMTDCSANSQVCVAGACVTASCTPNQLYCEGNSVRRCNANGGSFTVQQTCTSSQYCDSVSFMCKPQVCTPNQPACAGTVKTTCNGDGSGYLTGGTDCSPLFCSNGQCVSELFVEDFENGTSQWTRGTGSYTSLTTTSSPTAAVGTYSLLLNRSSSVSAYFDGLYHIFTNPVQPRSISFWIKADTLTVEPYIAFSSTTAPSTTTSSNIYIYTYDDYIYVNGSSTYLADYSQWHHVELTNIDWTLHQFSLAIDGTAEGTKSMYSTAGSGISRIDLFNYYYTGNAYFDQIQLDP